MLRSWRVLYILTSKCAFRHSGVQFLMSPLSTYLRTRRFNRPTFGLTRHTNLWKNTAFRDFSNIWRGCIFFRLTFWLLHLLSTDLITLLLLFNSPYCRKFLFKLPSTNYFLSGVILQVPVDKDSIQCYEGANVQTFTTSTMNQSGFLFTHLDVPLEVSKTVTKWVITPTYTLFITR